MQGPHMPNEWPNWLVELFCIFLCSYLFTLLFDDKTNFHYEKKYKPQFLSNQMKRLLIPSLQNCSSCSNHVTSWLSHDNEIWPIRAVPEFWIFFCSYLSTILSDDKNFFTYYKKAQFLSNQMKRPSFPPLQNCSCCSNYITSRLSHDFSHVKFDR